MQQNYSNLVSTGGEEGTKPHVLELKWGQEASPVGRSDEALFQKRPGC
jgi:hypothetical protein